MDYSNIEKIEQKKYELENAHERLSKTVNTFNDTQEKTRDIFMSVIEKMALYSAGIISLSITFFGYLISQNKTILSNDFLTLPLYFYLYISWVMLALNLVISLVVKWCDGLYIYSASHHDWIKNQKEYQEKLGALFKTEQPIVFREGENKKTEIEKIERSISTLSKFEENSQGKEKKFYGLKRFLQRIAFITFALGIISLVIFAIKSTYSLLKI